MYFQSDLRGLAVFFVGLPLVCTLGAPLPFSERTSLLTDVTQNNQILRGNLTRAVQTIGIESANGTAATSRGDVLLREDQKDPCLKELSNKARAECIQPILETYYGPFFSLSCPFLPLQLAHGNCTGCPWDRINPSTILRRKHEYSLFADKYFHEPERTCSVANHVRAYKTWKNVNKYVYKVGLVVGLFVLFISSFGVSSGPIRGISPPITTLGFHIREPIYLAILFITYNLGSIIHLVSLDYFLYCESLASSLSQYGVVELIYVTVLYISVSRCLRLPSGPRESGDDPEESSWMSYAIIALQNEHCNKKDYFLAGFVVLVPCILTITYLVEITVNYEIGDPAEGPYCFAGQKDYAMGAIQFSKILLEFLSVVIYAFGPQRRQFKFWLRCISLAIIMFLSWVVFVVMFSFAGLYKPNGLSMLIPRALDQDIAYDFVELVHTNLIALLGLLEPFRFNISRKQENLRS